MATVDEKLDFLKKMIESQEKRIEKLERTVSMVDVQSCDIGDPHCNKNFGGDCSGCCDD